MENIRGEREERGESLGERKESKNQWLNYFLTFNYLKIGYGLVLVFCMGRKPREINLRSTFFITVHYLIYFI